MTLSFCLLTKDSAGYVERLLRSVRPVADEIVVAVDASSTDGTEKVCGGYADKLFRVEPVGYLAPALGWLHQQCSGDWVLRLDDDELPSGRLLGALPELMQDGETTHYWLRRRWLSGQDPRCWISEHPWWPDWSLRLHRNIPSIAHVPARVHTRVEVWGAARYVYEGSIYHLDLLYHDVEQRRKKVYSRYESRAPGKGLVHVYLPEETSPATLPLPEDDPPPGAPEPGPRSRWGALFGGRSRPKTVDVSLAEVRRASMQEFEPGPSSFRAHLGLEDPPKTMKAGGWHPVDVQLRNESDAVWPLDGLGSPLVRVGYQWLHADGKPLDIVGHRTPLPHTLWPGQSARMPASVLAPDKPGDYLLRWDLVAETFAWFSARGWKGPEIQVKVEGA